MLEGALTLFKTVWKVIPVLLRYHNGSVPFAVGVSWYHLPGEFPFLAESVSIVSPFLIIQATCIVAHFCFLFKWSDTTFAPT
jgi:hypothetical protein